jgi:threonine dehydrogenase-like Zn-dependent dehydrogenase
LSVVEKAVETGLRLHPGEPRRALVIGAGSIGLLAAALFRLRGFNVAIVSVEPADSARAKLALLAGAEYRTSAAQKADIVIEAAGSPDAVGVALEALAPLGILVILGAQQSAGVLPLIDVIVGNQIVAGSVNASPKAFADAAADLPRLPRALLNPMIEYRPFSAYRRSFIEAPAGAPKVVHRIG